MKVWNKQDVNYPKNAIYVGRPTKWGNPFWMRSENERDTVCEKYEAWIKTKPELIAAAKNELKGKDLVCFCAPRRCHADTLLRIANSDP